MYDNLIHSHEEDVKGRNIIEAIEWMRQNGIQSYRVLNHSEIEAWLVRSPVVVQVHWTPELALLQPRCIYSGPANPAAFEHGFKHAMLVVGFATAFADGRQRYYWLVGNSHGEHRGENGYYRIDRELCHGRYLVEDAVGLDVLTWRLG
ncbi:hypothetical protein RIF29_40303 [Crotalaria pallida]|uniref:Peptidase C1A papain C-terminal domain-containing protein n=1 Tax=Crotalaria pallida TaxID=3830 RepID=A0AAN9E5B8_CROPI